MIAIPAPASASSASASGSSSKSRSRSPRGNQVRPPGKTRNKHRRRVRKRRTCSRTRRRRSSSSTSRTRSTRTSDFAYDSEGDLVRVEPNTNPGPHGPPPPEPVNEPAEDTVLDAVGLYAATLSAPIEVDDLRGVWRDPPPSAEPAPSSGPAPSPGPAPFSLSSLGSLSSLTLTSTASWSTTTTSPWTSTTGHREGDVASFMQRADHLMARRRVLHPASRRRVSRHPCTPRRRESRLQPGSRAGQRMAEDAERIRRAVDEILQQGVGCDHRDFVRRMLDHIRRLQREVHVCGVAVEQALSWWPRPQGEEAWNAGVMEDAIRREINAAIMGMGPAQVPVTGHAVLLQPDFPTGSTLASQLPGVPRDVVAGLRRRVWQSHMAATATLWNQPDTGPHRWRDAPLFLVPAGDTPPQNMPVGCALPEDPLHCRANLGCAARRRQQRVPPRRRLLPPYGELLPGGDLPGGELPARPAVPARPVGDPDGSRGNSHRDRSRSRDDSEDAEARAFAVHRGLSYPRRRRTSSPHSSPEH